MMLHELAPAPGSKRRRRRLGRGHGSGRGTTAGKGTKGQKARSGGTGGRPFFEGGQNPWTMRIPHRRGFSNRRFRVEAQILNLRDLEHRYASGDTVTIESLAERGLIDDVSGRRPVKILGDGRLTKMLTIQVHAVSAGARAAIEAAGGTVTLLSRPAKGQPAATGAGSGAGKASVPGTTSGTRTGAEPSA